MGISRPLKLTDEHEGQQFLTANKSKETYSHTGKLNSYEEEVPPHTDNGLTQLTNKHTWLQT